MELIKKVYLMNDNDKYYLKLEGYPEDKLWISEDEESDLEPFFQLLIKELLNGKFKLELVADEKHLELLRLVSSTYIERLNTEIVNIVESKEYRIFSIK